MKNLKLFFVLIIIATLNVVIVSCKNNDDPEPTQVTHTVSAAMDTAALLALTTSATPIDGTAFVSFGQPATIPNADFTTEVNVNDQMIWRGTTAIADHIIIINYIAATTAINFFDGSIPTVGLPEGEYGLNVASGNPGERMPYLIYFQLKVGGVLMAQEYFTDPKIQIN